MKEVLFFRELDYWGDNICSSGVSVLPIFKEIPEILKPFRIIHFKYNFPYKKAWFKNWKDNLVNFDIIILPASYFTVYVAKYIDSLKIQGNIRFIYWYWDPVRSQFAPDKISSKWEKWSFDKRDCRRFGLLYNSQFFFEKISLPKETLRYDVAFVGQDKGRIKTILELEEKFSKLDIKSYFHIVADKVIRPYDKIYKKKISYEKVLQILARSKAILELYQENQSGLTLRSMESIFFKKKLITNNENVVEYSFYRKENIFILGADNTTELKNFIDAPYKELDSEIIHQYNFKEWKKRLEEKVELRDES